jgi:hypothetical protein
MLIVGYDRARKFFVVKNQWGPTNYSKVNFAKGWNDVIRYNGFVLVDYNYLGACSEAHWITEVAPMDSMRLLEQRAIGQWQVTFRKENTSIVSGVLIWRHLSHAEAKPPDLRIGDLVIKDGKESKTYRVNAKLEGDGKKPFKATLYIDFNTGEIPGDSTDGMEWKGTLSNLEKGDAKLELSPAEEAKESLWGVRPTELKLIATQNYKENLLLKLPPPK